MIIGLMGNSGGGKSLIASILHDEYGAHVIDADEIAHAVIRKDGVAYAEVVAAFGAGVLGTGGEIDRRKLGAVVFGDERRRAQLTQITHKYIIKEMLTRLTRAKAAHVLMDAPLLVEAGLDKVCDTVWLVVAPAELRAARIVARDGLTEAEARQRIAGQTARDELIKHADVIIDNSGSKDELTAAVHRLMSGALKEENK